MSARTMDCTEQRIPERLMAGELFERLGKPVSLPGNRKVFKRGEAAAHLCRVESGCIRTFDEDDGRRRIHAFYFPGDYFGLEDCETHSASAETVAPSRIRCTDRKTVLALAERDVVATNLLLQVTAAELERVRNHKRLLLKGAHERVVDFLMQLRRRGQNGSEVDLPMSRSDIADYLALSNETVSRALTQLRNRSTISMLTQRRFVLHGDPVFA
jgi:CRP/FNR family nitrogen fixation transcriptional regulator